MSKGSGNRSDTDLYRKNAGKVKQNNKPSRSWESEESKKRNNRKEKK